MICLGVSLEAEGDLGWHLQRVCTSAAAGACSATALGPAGGQRADHHTLRNHRNLAGSPSSPDKDGAVLVAGAHLAALALRQQWISIIGSGSWAARAHVPAPHTTLHRSTPCTSAHPAHSPPAALGICAKALYEGTLPTLTPQHIGSYPNPSPNCNLQRAPNPDPPAAPGRSATL